MRVLALGDMHGDLASVHRAIDQTAPDLILSCGDWGDPEEVAEQDLRSVIDRVPVYTTFGNHDPVELLGRLRNHDGSNVLMPQGAVVSAAGLRFAAIGGIWAKSHARPYYVTDVDVDQAARVIAAAGPVDVLLTHGCPIGMADRTPSGRPAGQRCFLLAFQTIQPQVHLCGHLHLAQEHILKDGRKVLNVGQCSRGSAVLLERDQPGDPVSARLISIPVT